LIHHFKRFQQSVFRFRPKTNFRPKPPTLSPKAFHSNLGLRPTPKGFTTLLAFGSNLNRRHHCQQVALAAEKAERDRADRFKDLETQAESAVKIEEAKEAAARNASLEAQDWAKKEEVALAVAQTRLEEAHAQEERQLDRMHAAEERANISRTVADSALAQLQV
jgi:hypothetical protein